MIICAISILLASLLDSPKQKASISPNNRNYDLNPFDINDAISACRHKARLEVGSSLQYTVVNDHSTRYDSNREVYFIVLDAYIESKADDDKNQIYCHVDSQQYRVNYIKTQQTKPRDLFFGFFK
jgi:hypothetical protein